MFGLRVDIDIPTVDGFEEDVNELQLRPSAHGPVEKLDALDDTIEVRRDKRTILSTFNQRLLDVLFEKAGGDPMLCEYTWMRKSISL